jgi:hypothetical protein
MAVSVSACLSVLGMTVWHACNLDFCVSLSCTCAITFNICTHLDVSRYDLCLHAYQKMSVQPQGAIHPRASVCARVCFMMLQPTRDGCMQTRGQGHSVMHVTCHMAATVFTLDYGTRQTRRQKHEACRSITSGLIASRVPPIGA